MTMRVIIVNKKNLIIMMRMEMNKVKIMMRRKIKMTTITLTHRACLSMMIMMIAQEDKYDDHYLDSQSLSVDDDNDDSSGR